MTCVAAGVLATSLQKLGGGEPSALGLMVNVAVVDAVVPVPFDTPAANVAPESPLVAAGVS
jgi:hypothetical protein